MNINDTLSDQHPYYIAASLQIGKNIAINAKNPRIFMTIDNNEATDTFNPFGSYGASGIILGHNIKEDDQTVEKTWYITTQFTESLDIIYLENWTPESRPLSLTKDGIVGPITIISTDADKADFISTINGDEILLKKGEDYVQLNYQQIKVSHKIPSASTTIQPGEVIVRTSEGQSIDITIEDGRPAIINGTTKIYPASVTATTFYATSDARLKTNIKPYSPSASILGLPIYEFDYVNNNKHSIGCLAQDLQKFCPEIVSEDKDGYLHIEENKLVYLLLQEIKELRSIIYKD